MFIWSDSSLENESVSYRFLKTEFQDNESRPNYIKQVVFDDAIGLICLEECSDRFRLYD